MSIGGFFDKRREFREDVEEGVAVLDDGVLRLVNWSRSGFLSFSRDWRGPPGTRFAAALALTAAGRHFHFHCTAEVMRMDPALGVVAARFVEIEPAVRTAIDRHFDPAAPLADTAYSTGGRVPRQEAERPAAGGSGIRGEADLPTVAAAGPGPVFGSLRAADPDCLAAAADCLAAVKAAFARRFHPDAAAPAPEDRAVRTRLFQEFWAELDAMERSVKAMREAAARSP